MNVDYTQFPQFKADMLVWLDKMEAVYNDPDINGTVKNARMSDLLFYSQ